MGSNGPTHSHRCICVWFEICRLVTIYAVSYLNFNELRQNQWQHTLSRDDVLPTLYKLIQQCECLGPKHPTGETSQDASLELKGVCHENKLQWNIAPLTHFERTCIIRCILILKSSSSSSPNVRNHDFDENDENLLNVKVRQILYKKSIETRKNLYFHFIQFLEPYLELDNVTL